jgi:hypothetical protein
MSTRCTVKMIIKKELNDSLMGEFRELVMPIYKKHIDKNPVVLESLKRSCNWNKNDWPLEFYDFNHELEHDQEFSYYKPYIMKKFKPLSYLLVYFDAPTDSIMSDSGFFRDVFYKLYEKYGKDIIVMDNGFGMNEYYAPQYYIINFEAFIEFTVNKELDISINFNNKETVNKIKTFLEKHNIIQNDGSILYDTVISDKEETFAKQKNFADIMLDFLKKEFNLIPNWKIELNKKKKYSNSTERENNQRL